MRQSQPVSHQLRTQVKPRLRSWHLSKKLLSYSCVFIFLLRISFASLCVTNETTLHVGLYKNLIKILEMPFTQNFLVRFGLADFRLHEKLLVPDVGVILSLLSHKLTIAPNYQSVQYIFHLQGLFPLRSILILSSYPHPHPRFIFPMSFKQNYSSSFLVSLENYNFHSHYRFLIQ